MKAVKISKLNTRLLAVFFLAVFVLALAELFVFSHLIRSISQEEQAINHERLNNSVTKLNVEMDEIRNAYSLLSLERPFNNLGSKEPTDYQLYEMTGKGKELFSNTPKINGWAILLKGTDQTWLMEIRDQWVWSIYALTPVG